MTDIELLRNVIGILDEISVPIKYTNQIAAPIAEASDKLKALYNYVYKKVKEEQEAEEKPEEDAIPDVSIEANSDPEDNK